MTIQIWTFDSKAFFLLYSNLIDHQQLCMYCIPRVEFPISLSVFTNLKAMSRGTCQVIDKPKHNLTKEAPNIHR